MKYLKYFQQESEYTQFKDSADYVLPNVSYVVAANSIYYESPVVIPHNEILYTTNDGNVVTPDDIEVFGANIVSNTYVDGKGVIEFDGDVTTIGDYAFFNCSNLTSITIPSSVTSIGENVFTNCVYLTSITIPDSVTSIGYCAFADCSSLTSVIISDGVTTIGEYAFRDCTSLISITIPNSVTTIGDWAFKNCTGELIINSKIVETDYSFGNYPSNQHWLDSAMFTKLTIGDSIEKIGNFAFSQCTSFTSITILDSVISIGDGAFQNCTSLTSVTIPDSVITIVDYAFFNCSKLISVYCKATTPPSLGGTRIFEGYAAGCKIYVPTNSVSAYKSAANWSNYADDIVGYDF